MCVFAESGWATPELRPPLGSYIYVRPGVDGLHRAEAFTEYINYKIIND